MTPAQAAQLSRAGGPGKVGLFVNPSDDDVARALDALPLDAVQLYAPPARLHEIGERFAVPLWHAVGVTTAVDLPRSAGSAAVFVIEPKPPAGADRPGGLAQSLDWSMLAGWSPNTPWFLAGGLTPRNVARAIKSSGANAVDVSSGVESEIGVKDPRLIAIFISAAREAEVDAC